MQLHARLPLNPCNLLSCSKHYHHFIFTPLLQFCWRTSCESTLPEKLNSLACHQYTLLISWSNVQEWDRMKAMGLVSAAGLVGSHQAQRLTAWACTAGADLTLVEALRGFPLDPAETLASALPGIFVDVSGRIFLSRYCVPAETLARALPGIFVIRSGRIF